MTRLKCAANRRHKLTSAVIEIGGLMAGLDEVAHEGRFVFDGKRASERYATRQAAQIMGYWHGRGHVAVKAWIYYDRSNGLVSVRSNLCRGMPPPN